MRCQAEVWYRRDEGLRVEAPEQVIVEDGNAMDVESGEGGELLVLRQRSPRFFATQLPSMLALPDVPGEMGLGSGHRELDRRVDGRACQGFTLSPPDPNRGLPQGPRLVGQPALRGLVLAEEDGRIHEITIQQRRDDGAWRCVRETRIEYDVPVPAEKIATRLPAVMCSSCRP